MGPLFHDSPTKINTYISKIFLSKCYYLRPVILYAGVLLRALQMEMWFSIGSSLFCEYCQERSIDDVKTTSLNELFLFLFLFLFVIVVEFLFGNNQGIDKITNLKSSFAFSLLLSFFFLLLVDFSFA